MKTKLKTRLVDPKSEEARDMEREGYCHYEEAKSAIDPGVITLALPDCTHLTPEQFRASAPSRDDFTLEEMLAEVERELGMRRQVYPRLLPQNMKRETADRQIGLMAALRDYLKAQIAKDGRQPDLLGMEHGDACDGGKGGVHRRGHHDR